MSKKLAGRCASASEAIAHSEPGALATGVRKRRRLPDFYPTCPAQTEALGENGFEFSNTNLDQVSESENQLADSQAA